MDQKNSPVADHAGQRGYRNVEKHCVSFEEAATVFDDPMFITFVGDEHSIDQERYITVGLSSRGRLLVWAHADHKDRILIVGA